MPTNIQAVFERIERGELLTAEERLLLASSEAEWDAFKDAEHADEARLERQPVGRAEHVHRDRGLVEVLKRTPNGWRYRSAGGVSVDTGDAQDFRPVMSAKEAEALLERLGTPGKRETLPTDAERRARLRSPVDVFDVAALERDYLYFAGLVASGASLWTMEKVPYRRVRQHLVEELSLVTGAPVSLPECD